MISDKNHGHALPDISPTKAAPKEKTGIEVLQTNDSTKETYTGKS